MTEHLYYTDSFLREFDAQVVSCNPREDGWEVRLDRTAFYPTSGGQPYDTGRLGESQVSDVIEREEDREILHIIDRPIPIGPVHGSIDWERRFDHIQQHTGQHLLSAAFLKLFSFPTVSFHLGREFSTIDLDAPNVVPRHLQEAADLVSRAVFDDRSITFSFHDRKELAGLGVRKAVEREGTLRIIEIEGFDLQPCGGTHAARTGQVGPVAIRKVERQKQYWRLEFVCGGRALRDAQADFEALGAAARQIGCGMPEVPVMVARLIEERKAAHRERVQLAGRLAELEANTLAAGGKRLVVHAFEQADAGFLRQVAALLVAGSGAEPGVRAVLASRGTRQFVFAQDKKSAGDMGRLLAETLSAAGGKGGGSRDFAQGTVPESANIDEILARARELLNRETG
ncbi:MAG TPA: DHHA1 domain-containing protein [Candidatus Dormibacteraeota bacterium]|nr:DHHA1 domain-containing protein [Candidatus Dormibacteraeota bacterium]